jgi:hypothetical protein
MVECWNIAMLGLEDWGNGVVGNGKKDTTFFYSFFIVYHIFFPVRGTPQTTELGVLFG